MGERQAKPRGEEAWHNPTEASQAVLTRTEVAILHLSHRTPQRHALYIHP